ncbi:phospho-beta-glycosidase [Secundilactobacillus pentosiphilus]|uniref:Phospho-beta-glycosidase n=1 Tax=Secundilactobacillus pentosiphilus TaxID=1714682 RepID=A0A1Z5ILT8_9LACO|nr:lysophospholipid acyltransferase family protein [Secundilactobacillus pentosiphilus]GAX02618.1 phospho-beta-glycosidase [Secundilactobacillus pentosiphilus]
MSNDEQLVVNNIIKAVKAGDLHRKVEVDDPSLSPEDAQAVLDHYLKRRHSPATHFKSWLAEGIALTATHFINRKTTVSGLEKIKGLHTGAIVTSNHFHPTENTAVRYALRQAGIRKMAVLSQVTNFKMTGFLGFLMNYANTIPVSTNLHYFGRDLPDLIEEKLVAGIPVLIYPEQEMWWRYRKPRPFMPGAYHYAAKFNVPIISCFTEMQVAGKAVNGVKPVIYHVHVLDPIYPAADLNEHANCEWMLKKDQQQKKAAYEAAYHETLTYQFEPADIVGWDYGNTTLATDLP